MPVGCTIIGDFHYERPVLLTKYPECAAALDKYPHQPRTWGAPGGDSAATSSFHDLQSGARSCKPGAHRRDAIAESRISHAEDEENTDKT